MFPQENAVIAADTVRLGGEARRIPLPPPARSGEASVEVLRDGEAIVGVEVACGCGRHIRLRFNYDPPA